jgi:hypothetical protein
MECIVYAGDFPEIGFNVKYVNASVNILWRMVRKVDRNQANLVARRKNARPQRKILLLSKYACNNRIHTLDS